LLVVSSRLRFSGGGRSPLPRLVRGARKARHGLWRETGADLDAPVAVLLRHNVDRIERAEFASIGAIANKAGVDVHLVGARVQDVALRPARTRPFGKGAGLLRPRLVAATLEYDQCVGGKPHAREVETVVETFGVARVHCDQEV